MNEQIFSSPWAHYSKKLAAHLSSLRYAGSFCQEDAAGRRMRCVVGAVGSLVEQCVLEIYWLVDLEDGVIVDARFQAFGPSLLVGLADTACELCIRKTYDQAGRIGVDLLENAVRDAPSQVVFSVQEGSFVNVVLEALDHAALQCGDIPLPKGYITPIESMDLIEGEGYPGWKELPHEQRLFIIEQVLDQDIRPYIELDAGGIAVTRLAENGEVFISYSGSCTTCYSSIGTTLSYIQQILRAKVDPSIVVTPNLEQLNLS